jgi:hypothetical protein
VNDNLEWLKEQRDRHAKARDEAFATDDWASGNPHDDLCRRYSNVINEIATARERLQVFTEVLQKRIIIAANEAHDKKDMGAQVEKGGSSAAPSA